MRKPRHQAYADFHSTEDWELISKAEHSKQWSVAKKQRNYIRIEFLGWMRGFKNFKEAKQYLIECFEYERDQAKSALREVKKRREEKKKALSKVLKATKRKGVK